MKTTQPLHDKAVPVTSNNWKNGLEEKLVWREGVKDQGELENNSGSVNHHWPEKGNFKRSRHGYTYYQSNF